MSASLPSAPTRHGRPWGRWVLLGLALLLAAGLAWLKWGLDPWLRRQLAQQARTQTHGQYALTVASLRTGLLARSLHLGGVVLRPATPTLADTLPRLTARLASLDLRGVGLLALLRGRTVPIDSLTLDSLQLDVAALARRPAPHPGPPLYRRRPLRLGYLALRHVGGSFGPRGGALGQLASADLSARDVLFTAAGAADSQRLAFAAAWQAVLRRPVGRLGGHTIAARQVDFSSARQFFELDSLHITPPAPGQGKPGAVRVSFALPRLRVRGLQAAAWQHRRHLRLDSARLSSPSLTFRPPAQAPPPLWKLLAGVFRRADFGHLFIDNGYLAVAGVAELPAVRHIFGEARSLRIDSASGQASARRVVYARAWAGHTGRITATLSPPVYPVSGEHLWLDTDRRVLRLTGLALRPTLTAAQLNRRQGYQLAQIMVRIPELRATGFDFQQLSANSHLRIGRVVAERPYLRVRSDGRGPLNPHRSVLTPEAVRQVRLHFDVRRLELHRGTIAAAYRSPRTPLVGTFAINQLNATLRNVSNDPRRMSRAHPLTGAATALLAGRCRSEVHLTASLLDPLGRQHLWGRFGPAPLAILNSMTRPTRLVAFKSGQVQGISFDERLDRQRIGGTMRATYTDLRFEFLGYKKGAVKKTLLNRVKSGLVNGLVIRDQNPRPGGRFVVGDMASRRQLKFSTFTAWRQGLLRGLLHSAGVPGKLAQKYSQQSDHGALPPR